MRYFPINPHINFSGEKLFYSKNVYSIVICNEFSKYSVSETKRPKFELFAILHVFHALRRLIQKWIHIVMKFCSCNHTISTCVPRVARRMSCRCSVSLQVACSICRVTISIEILIPSRSCSRVVTFTEYTLSLTYPRRKKSRGVRSGDRCGHRIGLSRSQFICMGIRHSMCSGLANASVEVLHSAGRAGLGIGVLPEGTQN